MFDSTLMNVPFPAKAMKQSFKLHWVSIKRIMELNPFFTLIA